MARGYILRQIHDPKTGKAILNARCEAYQGTTLAETVYSDTDGTATFTALPDTGPIDIKVQWGHNSLWFTNVPATCSIVVYNGLEKLNAWEDLDLSAVVGARVAVVLLEVTTTYTGIVPIMFRTNGEVTITGTGLTTTPNIGCVVSTNAASVPNGQVIVKTDSAGIVEWYGVGFMGIGYAHTVKVKAVLQ